LCVVCLCVCARVCVRGEGGVHCVCVCVRESEQVCLRVCSFVCSAHMTYACLCVAVCSSVCFFAYVSTCSIASLCILFVGMYFRVCAYVSMHVQFFLYSCACAYVSCVPKLLFSSFVCLCVFVCVFDCVKVVWTWGSPSEPTYKIG